jgi:hypothetical protein
VSIIRSLPPLHMQPLVTVWCCVGCVLQPCSVVTAIGPSLHMQPLVTVWCCVGCVLQPCSVVTAIGSNNRTGLWWKEQGSGGRNRAVVEGS